MSKFSASLQPNQTSVIVHMRGNLDEDANLQSLQLQPFSKIQLDLHAIDCVTSRGIRAWLLWLKGLDSTKEYTVRRCSRVFVNQANLVKDMLPKWMKVQSVNVSYYCDNCEHSTEADLQLVNSKPPQDLSETISCDKCGEMADLDIQPDRYFQFLNR